MLPTGSRSVIITYLAKNGGRLLDRPRCLKTPLKPTFPFIFFFDLVFGRKLHFIALRKLP